MSGVTVKVDARKWTAALRKAPGIFRVASKAALGALGKTVAGEISKQGMRGRPGLKRRTGTLARSLTTVLSTVGKDEKAWVGFVLPGARYAGIHETGGVIRAGSKLLAIPVGPALTPSGVPKYPGPRSVPDLVFLPRRGGGLLGKWKTTGNLSGASLQKKLAKSSLGRVVSSYHSTGGVALQQKHKLTHFEIWYVLKKEVRIPPRLGFFRTWRAFFAGPKPKAIIQREINKAVRAINGVP